jgi:prepilin-type N-terminal cleavage/methylation domain-containing protein
MKTVHRTRSRRPAEAFTLIELLVVIAIIGILIALLFPALNAAINKARRTAALTEVKGIEMALKKYYQEYTGWPNTASYGIPDAEARALPIKGPVVRMMRGENDGANNNIRQLVFMDFSHLDSAGDPVNPWGVKIPSRNTYEHYYYAKFDTDFNNVINAGSGAPPNNEPANSTRSGIIVWTYNPKVPASKPDHVIGSWSR